MYYTITAYNLKKIINSIIIIAITAFIILCINSCDSKNEQDAIDYYTKINNMIQDYDFNIARTEDSKIILYDSSNTQIGEIDMTDQSFKYPIVYIKKEDYILKIITGGAVDDEHGIVFINNDLNNALDGITSISRVGGNSYKYSSN